MLGDPVEGLYYGAKEYRLVSGKWDKEWDAFHDARVSAPTDVLE